MPILRNPGVAAAFGPFEFYLGPHDSDPTLDNNGDPLVEGTYYWNTVGNKARFYTGTEWTDFALASGSVTGSLDVDGNLNVDGTTNLEGSTVIDDTLNVTGAVDFDTTLNVDGASTFVGVAKFGDGTAAAPSVTFSSETDTGMYKYGANSTGFSVGGVAAIAIDPTGFISALPIKPIDGDATAPYYSFYLDSNTGFYRIGDDNIGVTANATVRWSWNTTRAWSSNPVYVGTDSSAGSSANTAGVVAAFFKSFTGSQSCTTGVATTLFAIPSHNIATYIITAALDAGDVPNYHAVYMLSQQGTSYELAAMNTGTLLSLSLSGSNLQGTQSSGITSTIVWTVTRIA